MEKWTFTLTACFLSLLSAGQVRLVDTSAYDSILVKEASSGVQHFIGIQNERRGLEADGGLIVFIENAEKDDLLGVTVQVMEGEKQVAGGVTDFSGFLFLPNIEAGTYEVVIKHICVGKETFTVQVKPGEKTELITVLESTSSCVDTFIIEYPIVHLSSEYPRVRDTSAKDSLPNNPPRSTAQMKGGLKVFITNAELDDIIGATVQVMNGEKQVAGGVADFAGFLYLPNIEAGTYTVLITYISSKESFDVTIKSWEITTLKEEMDVTERIIGCSFGYPQHMLIDPFVTTYTTDQIIRTP